MSSVAPTTRVLSFADFRNELIEKKEIVIPECETLVINEMSVEDCIKAEEAISKGHTSIDAIAALFQKAMGDQHGIVRIGTLGVFDGKVSSKLQKCGGVASWPLHITLNKEIVYETTLGTIFKQMLRRQMQDTVLIQPGQKLHLKDIGLMPLSDDIRMGTFIQAVGTLFGLLCQGLNREEMISLSRGFSESPGYNIDVRNLKIESVAEGILLSSESPFRVQLTWQANRSGIPGIVVVVPASTAMTPAPQQ